MSSKHGLGWRGCRRRVFGELIVINAIVSLIVLLSPSLLPSRLNFNLKVSKFLVFLCSEPSYLFIQLSSFLLEFFDDFRFAIRVSSVLGRRQGVVVQHGHVGGRGIMVHFERDLGKVTLVRTRYRNMSTPAVLQIGRIHGLTMNEC